MQVYEEVMPVTISGDATKRIEVLVTNLSDDRIRDLTVQLRDSLVRRLWNVQWRGGPSILIGRGLTAYTEPVRTPTGGWMCGVGSLDILHREDAPPHTIADFLEWYRSQYVPAEKERRAAEKATKAQKPEPSPAAKAAQRLKNINVALFGQYRIVLETSRLDVDLRERLYEFRARRNDAVRGGRDREVMSIDTSMRALDIRISENTRRMYEAEARLAELRAQR